MLSPRVAWVNHCFGWLMSTYQFVIKPITG